MPTPSSLTWGLVESSTDKKAIPIYAHYYKILGVTLEIQGMEFIVLPFHAFLYPALWQENSVGYGTKVDDHWSNEGKGIE